MTALITPTELTQHISPDLGTDALQRLIDAADADIVRYCGTHDTAQSYIEYTYGNAYAIYLPLIGVSVESVSLDGTEMDASAYRLEMAGRRLVHLPEFTPYPMGRLSVSYTARDTTAQRRLATIRLCTLESEYIGVSSRGAGVVSITPADYRSDRAEILRSLAAHCTGRWV